MTLEAAQEHSEAEGRHFPCESCGADLEFNIGVQSLRCPFCGHIKAIDFAADADVHEQDLTARLAAIAQERQRHATGLEDAQEVTCQSCGGTVVFSGTLTSTTCSYCGSPIQRQGVHRAQDRIPADAVLTFAVEPQVARHNLARWVKSRWFAPSEFKKRGVGGKLEGVYLPYFTFDALTYTRYRGERGDHYYVTVGSGNNRRQERRTRWTPAAGAFQRFFDDVLVPAVKGLPKRLLDSLEPWPLGRALPFAPELLAGKLAHTYDVELDVCFEEGKARIEHALAGETRQRIGGDVQRIHAMAVRYDALTYKHLLLPVWLLAYRYGKASYQVAVNACTGEVQGERPYSAWKIAAAVLLGAVAAAAVWWMLGASSVH